MSGSKMSKRKKIKEGGKGAGPLNPLEVTSADLGGFCDNGEMCHNQQCPSPPLYL